MAKTHGMVGTPEYFCWQSMLYRCRNKNHKAWKNYGGRGIAVCKRWHSFSAFFSDMGPRPPGYMLDRIDNDGNYEPSNCRWVSFRQQQFNKRTNVMLEHNGETRCITEWAEILGLNTKTLFCRYHQHGMRSPEIFENIRRRLRPITINGETRTLKDWSRRNGISYNTVISRIHQQGWSPVDAVSIPPS